MLSILLLVILFACVAMLWSEGLWGNAITLVNVVAAALIATNYFEPLAAFLNSQMASFTYFCDFLALWGIFVAVYSVMRAVTDFLTRTKVRFKMPVEQAGRVLLAVAVGYVMVCFTAFSLHVAPLPEHAFRGAFHQADVEGGKVQLRGSFFGLSPDQQWLAFAHSRSTPGGAQTPGALARWWDQRQFDPQGRFVFKYGARRRRLEEYNKETGAMRVRGG